jgi:hypothetical protein
MNDDTLLARLAPVTDEQAASLVSRQALGELAEDIIRSTPPRPTTGPARQRRRPVNPTRRRLTWAAASAVTVGAVAAAAAVVVIARGGQPASGGLPGLGRNTAQNATSGASQRPGPAASTTLTAWTVTENRDGTLSVTIREMADPSGLQATLRADGARVVVTASLAWPAGCSQWRSGSYTMGDQVVQTENRTGLPSANGTEFRIRPSDRPAGALLWVGLSQTGKPKGVVGPAGPMGFGYLTANQACTRS